MYLHLLYISFPTRRASDLVNHVVKNKGSFKLHKQRQEAGQALLIAVYANMPAERRDQASRFLHLAPGHIIQMGNEIKAHAAHAGGIKLADLIAGRSEEHTSELQSLMRISYAVFCLTKKRKRTQTLSETTITTHPVQSRPCGTYKP